MTSCESSNLIWQWSTFVSTHARGVAGSKNIVRTCVEARSSELG